MNEVTTTATAPDFSRGAIASPNINSGAVAIEQERAIAEAQGQLILAKRFPRSMAAAKADLMEACKSQEFAASAFYSVPNRGSGPSIRFMEEAARCYGNFQFGHRELSRSKGKSEVEVFAWDMEKNNRSIRQITVEHTIDTKNGPKPCRDQSDIDNLIANKASKQVRGRIAALLPKDLIAAGVAECKKTLAGDNDEPISSRVTRMVSAFSKYGVTAEMLGKYVGHTLDTVTVDELADMIGVFNAIREGAKPSEYFAVAQEADAATGKVTAADIAKQSEQKQAASVEAEKVADEPSASEDTPAQVLGRIITEMEATTTEADFQALAERYSKAISDGARADRATYKAWLARYEAKLAALRAAEG